MIVLPDDTTGPARARLNPRVKLIVGLVVGVAAVWLVVSTAGGVGDAIDAVRRMRSGFVEVALAAAAARLALYGLQLLWLGRRSGPLAVRTAFGLALVVFGFGAVTPAAPAEGLTIASRELQQRGRTKGQARLTLGLCEWFAQRTFYVVAAIDLIVVVSIGHLAFADSWPLVIGATMVLFALAGTAVLARRPTSAERVAVILAAIRIRQPKAPAETTRAVADVWHAQAMEMRLL